VGLSSWQDATAAYPTASLLVMAVGMSVPMAGWMLLRGMGTRNTAEMVAVMVLPVVPFCVLVWLGSEALCGLYCLVTVVAMIALMRFRRDAYTMHHA
jgi:hypothetical protein